MKLPKNKECLHSWILIRVVHKDGKTYRFLECVNCGEPRMEIA